ncbi:hypothetical protein DXH95_03120 [Sphingorhabdus pulchriflava]|uniref:Ribbon-helix-helix protein CopG domain-containing protein n=1 Tax=Sphingorhabdus pulchriflava TaxID=2292257 RepID=A0A371BFQ7_9SPHN|nr:hypothetical protein DXH95_03120 [Sphingorhabdus pulchriflava]
MASSIINDNKKRRGRPATGLGTMVGVRLQPKELEAIDSWATSQPDQPSRPEAIRRIVRQVLLKD